MTADESIIQLREHVLDENMDSYRELDRPHDSWGRSGSVFF
jgi:hypothetical protein